MKGIFQVFSVLYSLLCKIEKGYVRFFEMYFINSSNDIIYKKSH